MHCVRNIHVFAIEMASAIRTLSKHILYKTRTCVILFSHEPQLRHRTITGHLPTDVALKTVTGGRVDRWMQAYEDYVGLTEVKQAQNNVLQAESKFLAVQEERRQTQQTLETIQSRLRAISAELEKTNRADDRYLDLVRNEHAVIREENEVVNKIRNLEKAERETFTHLSSALRDSHEKERARAEKTKYWSIIGSIIGAMIGIIGSTVNNYLKMKEMRGLVASAGENSEELRNLSMQLCESVRAQSQKMDSLLGDLHPSLVSGNASKTSTQLEQIRFSPAEVRGTELQKQTERILQALKTQEESLDAEIREIRKLLGIEKSQVLKGDETVVYVGPEMESIMKRTEESLERKIKYSALASATFVYGALALTLPVIFSFFRGGS